MAFFEILEVIFVSKYCSNVKGFGQFCNQTVLLLGNSQPENKVMVKLEKVNTKITERFLTHFKSMFQIIQKLVVLISTANYDSSLDQGQLDVASRFQFERNTSPKYFEKLPLTNN